MVISNPINTAIIKSKYSEGLTGHIARARYKVILLLPINLGASYNWLTYRSSRLMLVRMVSSHHLTTSGHSPGSYSLFTLPPDCCCCCQRRVLSKYLLCLLLPGCRSRRSRHQSHLHFLHPHSFIDVKARETLNIPTGLDPSIDFDL